MAEDGVGLPDAPDSFRSFCPVLIPPCSRQRLQPSAVHYYSTYPSFIEALTDTAFKVSDPSITVLKQGGPDGRELTQTEAGFPTISIAGYQGLGESGGSDYDFTRTIQFVDNFSLFHGNHSLRMAVDIRRAMSDANTINWP